jgi:hypothetical protein
MRDPDHLALQAQAGDEEAYRELFDRFRPAVEGTAHKVAERWRRGDLEADLCQEGFCGLLHAVRNYDPVKGPFQPWAFRHIGWAVKSGLYRFLGLEPREARAVLKAVGILGHTIDDTRPEEIARITGLDVEKVQAILATLRTEPADEAVELVDLKDPGAGDPGLLVLLRVCHGLGADGFKFAVLLLLRDMEYGWDEVAGLLAASSPGAWTRALKAQYPSVLEVFPDAGDWPAVRNTFRTPPPALTPEALRQFFCRLRQRILRAYGASA